MLGQGIGVAFVATVYSVGLANLVFLPIGTKLRTLVREETRLEEMIAIGITAIPRTARTRASSNPGCRDF